MDQITELLKAAQAGDKQAFEDLFGLVYAELHRLAVIRMAGESPGHTLQPTALVHEVWLKFHSGSAQGVSQITGHGHFLAVAARAMRQILIDHARRKLSLKRGSNSERVDLNEIELAIQADDDTLILIHEALEKLAVEDPKSAEIIQLRFFVGLGNKAAAEALGISERTAKRHWTFARAWLYKELQNSA